MAVNMSAAWFESMIVYKFREKKQEDANLYFIKVQRLEIDGENLNIITQGTEQLHKHTHKLGLAMWKALGLVWLAS